MVEKHDLGIKAAVATASIPRSNYAFITPVASLFA
jgi:hypothetical protein